MDLLSAVIKLFGFIFGILLLGWIALTIVMSVYYGNVLPQLTQIVFSSIFVIPLALVFLFLRKVF